MIAAIIAFFLVTLFPGVLMIVAAVKMKRLRAYWLAVVAGILAIILSPAGFFIGLPIGIWALVVLSQREVRTAFGHRRQKSRPVLKTVITIAIVVAVAIGACVAARETMYLWQLSQIPKRARIASIERRYRRQLDKLAECAFDYDHFKSVTRREGDEVSRLFADHAIVKATVYNSNDENKGGIGLKSGERSLEPGSSCWFCRSPSIGNPVLNLWTRGDHQFVEYCACLLDRTGVERSYTILFDPSKMAETGEASAPIAGADNVPNAVKHGVSDLPRQVPPQPASSESAFSARLPNGITVQLLGVSEHPSKDRPWWQPNGLPLAQRPYDWLGSSNTPGERQVGREIAVQLGNLSEKPANVIWKVTPSFSTVGVNPVSELGKATPNVYAVAAAAPAGKTVADVGVGVAGGPWNTVLEASGHSSYSAGVPGGFVAFSRAYEKDGKIFVPVATSLTGVELRSCCR